MQFNLENVCFKYAKHLDYTLNNISLSCSSSNIIGLAGANGSGKTTLIKIMLGQLVGFEGLYKINEEKIHDFYGNIPARFSIGYSPDASVLDDTLTGYEILSLVADIRTVSKADFDLDITSFSTLLHIENWMYEKKCATYSTGMRKKISLCIALLGSPAFTVLDEPTNGLDPISVFGLKKLILDKKAKGIGCLVASHILDFVEKIADNVVLLKKGALAYSGSLAKLREQWPKDHSLEEIYFTLFNT